MIIIKLNNLINIINYNKKFGVRHR